MRAIVYIVVVAAAAVVAAPGANPSKAIKNKRK